MKAGALGYVRPGANEMPAIKIAHLPAPVPDTEYGMEGMGEGGAIANAVRDALAAIGAALHETPMTSRRVSAAIRAAQNNQKNKG